MSQDDKPCIELSFTSLEDGRVHCTARRSGHTAVAERDDVGAARDAALELLVQLESLH